MKYINLALVYFTMAFGFLGFIDATIAAEKLQSRFSNNSVTTDQNLLRIRFGMVVGSPPFGFLDRQNRLSGLNVDLVRRICDKLASIPNCEIQAISPDDLETVINTGTVDALIGAIAPSHQRRAQFNFSKPYILPSYFLIDVKNNQTVSKKGVLKDLFPANIRSKLAETETIIEFGSYQKLFDALVSRALSSAFIPSHAAQFWLLSAAADQCCTYSGAVNLPFIVPSPHRIVTKQDNGELHALIESALHELEVSGELGELRKRYLPLNTAR